jgi:hypothetical protein
MSGQAGDLVTCVVNENGLRELQAAISALNVRLTHEINYIGRDLHVYMNKFMEIEAKIENIQRHLTENNQAESLRIEDVRTDIWREIHAMNSKIYDLNANQQAMMAHGQARR